IALAPPADILHDLIGVEFECPVRSQAPERTSLSDEQLRSGVDLPELGIGEFQVPLEVIPRASVRVCQVVAHGLPSSLLALARSSMRSARHRRPLPRDSYLYQPASCPALSPAPIGSGRLTTTTRRPCAQLLVGGGDCRGGAVGTGRGDP